MEFDLLCEKSIRNSVHSKMIRASIGVDLKGTTDNGHFCDDYTTKLKPLRVDWYS
jgi:hypothetical protein